MKRCFFAVMLLACAWLAGCQSAPMAQGGTMPPGPPLAMEEFMVPSADAGISLYVRNKHAQGRDSYPGVEIGEGTHTVIMEKNRMQLFQAVQQFLDETIVANQ